MQPSTKTFLMRKRYNCMNSIKNVKDIRQRDVLNMTKNNILLSSDGILIFGTSDCRLDLLKVIRK